MEHNVVSWFEIPVKDMGRAKNFYKGILGGELTDMEMPGMEMEMAAFPWAESGVNASGALVKMEGYEPSGTAVTVYFHSEDAAVELGRVEENGGTLILPKTPIGEGHGFFGLALDTEGNRIGFHSRQ